MTRLCLPVDAWPPPDRDAWAAAHHGGGLLDDDGLISKSSATAAVLFGNVRQQHSRLACNFPSLDIGMTLFSPFLMMRGDVVFNNFLDRPLKNARIFGHPRRFIVQWSHST